MPILYPKRLRVAMSLGAPSVTGRLSAICLSTPSSIPLRSLMRCLKLSWKSISPLIAASVMSATSLPTPACFASSSITSHWISVESMSKSTILLLRRKRSSSWKPTSISLSSVILKRSSLSFPMSGPWLLPLPLTSSCSANRLLATPHVDPCLEFMRERRVIPSMLRPYSARRRVTLPKGRALQVRETTVTMNRGTFSSLTHLS
mmetsp:Transcript_33310/g.77998  ORF Transcript_33310/g.77998 Transcript_33310/m.77998 type:complete len:204 (+) Transcript_33310:463-1074(+)